MPFHQMQKKIFKCENYSCIAFSYYWDGCYNLFIWFFKNNDCDHINGLLYCIVYLSYSKG